MEKIVESLKDEVIEVCENCQREFVAKYWDEELSWYIEVNTSPLCRTCQDLHSKENKPANI